VADTMSRSLHPPMAFLMGANASSCLAATEAVDQRSRRTSSGVLAALGVPAAICFLQEDNRPYEDSHDPVFGAGVR
jgi:hypothetical protein